MSSTICKHSAEVFFIYIYLKVSRKNFESDLSENYKKSSKFTLLLKVFLFKPRCITLQTLKLWSRIVELLDLTEKRKYSKFSGKFQFFRRNLL